LKRAAEKDAEEYQRLCEQERRESVAFRNQEGRKHRELEERIRSEKLSADHESYELSWEQKESELVVISNLTDNYRYLVKEYL
jgi:hypothetical protein